MTFSFTESAGTVYDGTKTSFTVWAPHADSVSVVGTFNDWDATALPLERGDDDHWRGVSADAGPGSEYKFVIQNGEEEFFKNDPRAREVTNSVGNSIVIDDTTFDWGNDASFQRRGWNELVIYELHLGTFYRGEEKDTVGTFDDAIERLDHLVGLGINAIELMPVAEFAGDQSWGYNPAFPFAIETDYGGVDGLKRFVKACHEHGIAVIMDVVYNHFGPSDLDMWRFDGWSEGDGGGIYFYNDWKANTPWGDTRPDYGRHEVRQYIRDNAMMWLEAFHIDGLRFDMTFYMRSVRDGEEIPEGWSLAQWYNCDIQDRFPGAITIAEDLRSNEWITKHTLDGGAGYGSQWDEQFVHPVRQVIEAQDDAHRSMNTIATAVGFRYNDDAFQRVIYTESHDEVANGKSRVPTEIDDYDQEGYWARKRSILGACLVMTSPGIPMIFQGQEFLAIGHFEDGNEMPWDVADHKERIIKVYRDLIHLRANSDGSSAGLQSASLEMIHVNDNDKIFAYARGHGDEQVIVVLNFSMRGWSHYRVGFTQSGKWQLAFHADAEKYGTDFSHTEIFDVETETIPHERYPQSCEIALGGYDCAIFTRS